MTESIRGAAEVTGYIGRADIYTAETITASISSTLVDHEVQRHGDRNIKDREDDCAAQRPPWGTTGAPPGSLNKFNDLKWVRAPDVTFSAFDLAPKR